MRSKQHFLEVGMWDHMRMTLRSLAFSGCMRIAEADVNMGWDKAGKPVACVSVQDDPLV